MAFRVLVIDGDDASCKVVCAHLNGAGISAHGICSGADLDHALTLGPYRVVVCNAELPDETGFSVIARLRLVSDAGVILLTAVERREDRILALSLGVDHYLARPPDLHELEMLIGNLHRRLNGSVINGHAPERTVSGGWIFDPARWTLTAPDGTVTTLSMAEHLILGCLLARAGDVVPRSELLSALNRPEVRVYSRNVDMIVSRLRRKVSQVSSERLPVMSARGIGYVFTGRGNAMV